jgi:hypothetical protein
MWFFNGVFNVVFEFSMVPRYLCGVILGGLFGTLLLLSSPGIFAVSYIPVLLPETHLRILRSHHPQIHMEVIRTKWKSQTTHHLVDVFTDPTRGDPAQKANYISKYTV